MVRKKKQFIDKKHCKILPLTPYANNDFENTSESEDRIDQQRKCGIFYDDEYDYLKHLKQRGERDSDLIDIIHVDADPITLAETLKQKPQEFIDDELLESMEAISQVSDFDKTENIDDNFVVLLNGQSASSIINSKPNELSDEYDSIDEMNSKFDQIYTSYGNEDIGSLSLDELDESEQFTKNKDICLEKLKDFQNFISSEKPQNKKDSVVSKKWENFNIDVPKDSPHITKYLYVQDESPDENVSILSDFTTESEDYTMPETQCFSLQSNAVLDKSQPKMIDIPFKTNNTREKSANSENTALPTKPPPNIKMQESNLIAHDKEANKERKQMVKAERRANRATKKILKQTYKILSNQEQKLHIMNSQSHSRALKLS